MRECSTPIPAESKNLSSFSTLCEEPLQQTDSSKWLEFLSQFRVITDSSAGSRLQEAYRFALRRSDDPRTQTGAMIPCDKGIAFGANRLPGALRLLDWRCSSEHKADYIAHAESSAVCSAASHGLKTAGQTMYAPFACCSKCSHAIIGANLRGLVIHKEIMEQTSPRWQTSVAIGLTNCIESGIVVEQFSGNLGMTLLFDGALRSF